MNSNYLELLPAPLRSAGNAENLEVQILDPSENRDSNDTFGVHLRRQFHYAERAHVQEMVEGDYFPENTLFVEDAGFVGYDFWRSMSDRGYDFMVRVGSNVKLISDCVDVQRTEGNEQRSALLA